MSGEPVERFLSIREAEIMAKRIELEDLSESFVSDRTVVDCFVYFLLTAEKQGDEMFGKMKDAMLAHIPRYTHLFYIPPNTSRLVDNGVRTVSFGFQQMIDWILRGVISDYGINVISLPSSDIDCLVDELQGEQK